MIIAIGSKNLAKILAIEEFFTEYLANDVHRFESVSVNSGVPDQPKTLEQTILGAKNRARAAFKSIPDAVVAVGLEGGLTPVPHTHTGYMNICAGVLYDGTEHYVGLSSGFEHPAAAIRLVFDEGLEIRDAYVSAGLEDSDEFSTRGGAIGFMTEQRLSRKEYCKQALITAFAAFRRSTLLVGVDGHSNRFLK